jgi:hypothetical protein
MSRSSRSAPSTPTQNDITLASPMTSKSAPTPRSFADTFVLPDNGVVSAVAGDGFGSAVADDVVGSTVDYDDASSFASMEEDHFMLVSSPLSRTKSYVHRYPAYPKSGAASAAPTTPSQMVVSTTVGKTKKGKGKKVQKNPNKVSPPPSEFGEDSPTSSLKRLTPEQRRFLSLMQGRSDKNTLQQMSED